MSKETVVSGVDIAKITEALGGPDITTITGVVTPVLRAMGISPVWDGVVTIGAAIVAILMALGYISKPSPSTSVAATGVTPNSSTSNAPTAVQVTLPPGMMLVPVPTTVAPVSNPSVIPATATPTLTPAPAPAPPVSAGVGVASLIGNGYTKV